MTERIPNIERTLNTYQIHGISLAGWHRYLVTDQETQEPTGHLATPASRYGRTSDECAWWAVALEVAMVHANGEEDNPYVSLDQAMSLVVNDGSEVQRVLNSYWHALPECLRDVLDRDVIFERGDSE